MPYFEQFPIWGPTGPDHGNYSGKQSLQEMDFPNSPEEVKYGEGFK